MLSTYNIFLEMSRMDFLRKSLLGGLAIAANPIIKTENNLSNVSSGVKPSKIQKIT